MVIVSLSGKDFSLAQFAGVLVYKYWVLEFDSHQELFFVFTLSIGIWDIITFFGGGGSKTLSFIILLNLIIPRGGGIAYNG